MTSASIRTPPLGTRETGRKREWELTLSPITLIMHQRSFFWFLVPYISFSERIFLFSLQFRTLKTLLFLSSCVTAAIFLSLCLSLSLFLALFVAFSIYPSLIGLKGRGTLGRSSKKSLYEHELWMSIEQAMKTSVSAKILPHLIRFFYPIIFHRATEGFED